MTDNMDLSKGGVKYDAGKPAYEYIAPEFLDGLATVLQYGAEKYAPRNWETGMRWGRPFGAMMRHMWAWWRGEDIDPETGFSHLWHAGCCLMFLAAYEARRIGEDDRNAAVDKARRLMEAARKAGPPRYVMEVRDQDGNAVRPKSKLLYDASCPYCGEQGDNHVCSNPPVQDTLAERGYHDITAEVKYRRRRNDSDFDTNT